MTDSTTPRATKGTAPAARSRNSLWMVAGSQHDAKLSVLRVWRRAGRYTRLEVKMPGFLKLSRLNGRPWELEGSMPDNNDSPDDERVRLHVRRILEQFTARQRQKSSAVASDVDREDNPNLGVRDGGDPT